MNKVKVQMLEPVEGIRTIDTTGGNGIAKPNVMRRFSTALVWYHRSEEMPHEGNRIIVMSPMYADNDPMKIRIIDSQFYKISKDAEWWAYVNCPPDGP